MSTTELNIRPATPADWPAIWDILRPIFRAGETYAVDRDISEDDARRYWVETAQATYVAMDNGQIVGTYYIRPNQQGGGAHVCNCGFAVAEAARGRGVARACAVHGLCMARASGFRAMQFNFVLASNRGALALWQSLGFEIVGTIPDAFDHPALGFVAAHVMHKAL